MTAGVEAPRRVPRRRPLDRHDRLVGYAFVAPQVLGVVAFVVVPLGLIFYYVT